MGPHGRRDRRDRRCALRGRQGPTGQFPAHDPADDANDDRVYNAHHHHVPGTVTTPITTTTTTTTTPAATLATVQLIPTGTVYVCAKTASGKTLIPGIIYSSGQTIPTLKSTELLITLGNNGVTMHADGKPYTVAASPAAIGLQVLPTGVSLLAAGKGPVC